MTSIHDDGPGSRPDEVSRRLQRLQLEHGALGERQDELESVLAASRTGFCRLDATLRMLRASSQLKAEFGYPPDAEFAWTDLLARVQREDRARLADAVQAAFSEGTDVALTVRVELPGRDLQWTAISGRTTSAGASDRADLILTARNVSAEQREAAKRQKEIASLLELERKLREGADTANREKDAFLSVISHELRSPLNAILGWNRILAQKRREDEEVSSIVSRIEQSAKAQLKIVNDLLDLARISAGKLTIEKRPMHLAQVAGLALDQARPTAVAKGIEIVAHLKSGADRMRGDPDRLEQVVANLLSNAIKFTPSGGRITVTLRAAGPFIELTVADTGKGMAPQLLPRVFDRFRQGDTSSTRDGGGLGLGLTLVREIVMLHGGTVVAESGGPGTGATFVVRLPAGSRWGGEDDRDADGPPRSAVPQSLKGLSILVVDDEMDARTVVAETLRLEGADVIMSDCVAAALAHLQSAHFDIVVTDIEMPEEDGYSLVRKMRQLRSGQRVLAIAVTGYASRSEIEAALDAGFDLHVPKPVDFDTFVSTVCRLARR
jgi:signal transduction histidine kinase